MFVFQVNWPEFLARNTSGSLTVEPQSSVLYSTAVVFSRVRTNLYRCRTNPTVCSLENLFFFFSQLLEYDDENDTAEAKSNFFPAYELKDFIWTRMNLSDSTATLCGSPPRPGNGSLCLQVGHWDNPGQSHQ